MNKRKGEVTGPLLSGIRNLLNEHGKSFRKPVRTMLENAEEVMKCKDAVWDFDREPLRPACKHCGGYFIRPEGKKEWHCSFKDRFPSWHGLQERMD